MSMIFLFYFQSNSVLPLQLNISDFLSVRCSLITKGLLPPENGICLPVTMPTPPVTNEGFPLFFPVFPQMRERHIQSFFGKSSVSNCNCFLSSTFV